MLGKLIKYEFKSTNRVMWILYIGLIIIGALMGFSLRSSADMDYGWIGSMVGVSPAQSEAVRVLRGVLAGVYGVLISSVYIMTIVMIVMRFYRSLLGGEGYLMHTLPVSTAQLIFSKLITSIIWMLIAGVASIVSVFALSATSGILIEIIKDITWEEIKDIFSDIFSIDGLLVMLMGITGVISGILRGYASMAIGGMANKNKMLYSVLAFVGIQIVLVILTTIFGFSNNFIDFLFTSKTFRQLSIGTILTESLTAVVFFVGTNYLLKNKLNLT